MMMDDLPICDSVSDADDSPPAVKPTPPGRSIGPESEVRGGPERSDEAPLEKGA
jgi:hypothetical protein